MVKNITVNGKLNEGLRLVYRTRFVGVYKNIMIPSMVELFFNTIVYIFKITCELYSSVNVLLQE